MQCWRSKSRARTPLGSLDYNLEVAIMGLETWIVYCIEQNRTAAFECLPSEGGVKLIISSRRPAIVNL